MTCRVAVLQSSYLPWKGFFDLIHDVDLFVFYDDVAYSRGNWRNRNRIKTAQGPRWLTVPVGRPAGRLICDVELPPGDWAAAHWRRIEASYAHAPYFSQYAPVLRDALGRRGWGTLSALNQHLIRAVAGVLGIATQFADSRDYGARGRKLDRLLDLLQRVGATRYVSGPAAKAYVDEQRFADAGIALEWKDYGGYPEYPQLHPPFLHQVFVFDLLFHVGPAAPAHIWGWRQASPVAAEPPAVAR